MELDREEAQPSMRPIQRGEGTGKPLHHFFSWFASWGGGGQYAWLQRRRPIQGVDAKWDAQRLFFSGPLIGGGGKDGGGARVSLGHRASLCHLGGGGTMRK